MHSIRRQPACIRGLERGRGLNRLREARYNLVLNDRLLESSTPAQRHRADPGGAEMAREGSQPRYKVELVLYVSSASPASLQARRNLELLLSRFAPNQVQWRVHDLGRDPLAGVEDRIAFTPTLVKRFPEPRMWVLGNLRETDLLADVLRLCGVEANE
jgi:hypothetical protein